MINLPIIIGKNIIIFSTTNKGEIEEDNMSSLR